jgi:hypothetical protein
MSKTVVVSTANKQGLNLMLVDDIKDWEPSKISFIGTSTYFKVEDTFYSMKSIDFREIFGHKIK